MSDENTENETQLASQSSREYLKEKFADNHTPTGNDFANLIDASINQVDDGVMVDDEALKLNKPLQIIGDMLDKTCISSSALNICDELTFNDQAKPDTFNVYSHLEVNKCDEFEGGVVIAKPDVDGSLVALAVTGNSKLKGDALIEGQVNVNGLASLNLGLKTKGSNQFEGDLNVQGSSTLQGSIIIGDETCIGDALLNIQNKPGQSKDLLRIDDTSNDPSPIIVKASGRLGVNTDDPQNRMDIKGNVRIGSSILMDGLDNSLSVEKRLGIGTASPSAMLDVHSTSESELLNISKGNDTLVRVKAQNSDDATLEINAVTTVNSPLSVTATFNAQSSVVSGLSQTKSLYVGSQENAVDGKAIAVSADSTFNCDVLVKGRTSLVETDVYGKLDVKELLIAKRVTIKNKLAIGTVTLPEADDVNTAPMLNIKSDSEQIPALLVQDCDEHDLIRVRSGLVKLGASEQPILLDVKGGVNTSELTVKTQSNLADVKISQRLNMIPEVGQFQESVLPRVDITSNPYMPNGISLSHQDGTTKTNLLSTKADKLGVHKENPEIDFHVGAASRFDECAEFMGGIAVTKQSNGEKISTLEVKDHRVTVGQADNEGRLDVYGDTKLNGNVSVNQVLAVTEDSLILTHQQGLSTFKISGDSDDNYLHANAGKLAINTPLSEYQLDVSGGAKIAGSLNVEQQGDVACAMTVTGNVEISDSLRVTGETSLADTVDVTAPVTITYRHPSVSTDDGLQHKALTIDGDAGISGSLSVAGGVTVNQGLTVTDAQITNIQGDAQIDKSLIVSGRLSADDELHVQGNNDSGVSLVVQKRADFQGDISLDGALGLSTLVPKARLHIKQTNSNLPALTIDSDGHECDSIVIDKGKLSIGIDEPEHALEVAHSAKVHQDLYVMRQTYLDNCLYVDQLATFSSNVKVHGLSELNGQTVIGDLNSPDMDSARTAQLCLFQNHYDNAFKIISPKDAPIVFSNGKLGIGTETPTSALDIVGKAAIKGSLSVSDTVEIKGKITQYGGIDAWGDVLLNSDLTVGDNTLLKDTLEVVGKTNIQSTLDVGKSTHLHCTLEVDKAVTLSSDLNVAGSITTAATLNVASNAYFSGDLSVSSTMANAQVTLSPDTLIKRSLTVEGNGQFDGKVSVSDCLTIGSEQEANQGKVAINHRGTQAALTINVQKLGSQAQPIETMSRALTVSSDGHIGINCALPSVALELHGDAKITQGISASTMTLADSIKLNGAMPITQFSNDITLGGELSSDHALPTQAAVKSYIDEMRWGFGDGGRTIIINSQREFDEVFNLGSSTEIVADTTIMLFPQNNGYPYVLSNCVKLTSGVSIVGFNQKTTVIKKQSADCRFVLRGTGNSSLIKDVHLTGFTFDGGDMTYQHSGGAFSMKYATNCQLNCHIINHKTSQNGGAIWGELEHGNQTVSNIEALHIRYCSADNNAGGAVYGLTHSKIVANSCTAKQGGAVAFCDDCHVEAIDNFAQAQGGGAYLCKNLLCDGFWRNNISNEGKNIYANDCDSHGQDHHFDSQYYWHAIYLDKPITDQHDYWRIDNI